MRDESRRARTSFSSPAVFQKPNSRELNPTEDWVRKAPGPFSFFVEDLEDDDLDEDICPLSLPHDGKKQTQLEADIEACQKSIGVKSCQDCTAWPYGRPNA
jgi:hypothetical protein